MNKEYLHGAIVTKDVKFLRLGEAFAALCQLSEQSLIDFLTTRQVSESIRLFDSSII